MEDGPKYGPQFAGLIQQLRQQLHKSQGLGAVLGLGKGVVASWEQQRRIPLLPNLFPLPGRLQTEFPDEPLPSQAQFLAAWLEAQDFDIDESLLKALRAVGPRRISLTDLSWLDAYVFTGERREEQGRTRLDCFIPPAAISDLRWLCGLRLDPATKVIPDKELTSRRWKDLVQRYGDRDILSISSGAVNAMTALLTDGMVFRFDVQSAARQAYRAFIRDMDHLENEASLQALRSLLAAADQHRPSRDPDTLLRQAGLGRNFRGVAEDVVKLLGGLTPHQFTSLFREGIIDPSMRTRFQHERADYAVISFARHPFGAKDKVALVIAGTNGTATAGAIKLLATDGIEGRPLGAVIRVRPPGADGEPRPEVVTPPYEPDDIVESIDMILDSGAEPDGPTLLRDIFVHWTDQELKDWKKLVASLGDLLAKR